MPSDKPGDAGNKNDGGDALTFEKFYEGLPEEHRALVDDHVGGLKSAHERVKSERKELKEAMQALRDGREADVNKVREELSQKLEATERRARFLESCPREIKNPTAALAVAREFDCIRSDGSLDAGVLKEKCPELFSGNTTPPMETDKTKGDNPPGGTFDMNAWIRREAGVA